MLSKMSTSFSSSHHSKNGISGHFHHSENGISGFSLANTSGIRARSLERALISVSVTTILLTTFYRWSMDYSAVGSAGMAVVSAGCDMMLSVGTSIVSLVSDSMLSGSIDAKICRRSSSGMAYFDDVVKDTISLPS